MVKNEEFLNEEKIHKNGKILKKRQMKKRGNLKVIKPSVLLHTKFYF